MADKDDVDSLNEEVSEIKRKWRNLSEKKRRDSFNTLISELANIVSTNGRKVDKSNVLKQTIAYLQKNNRNANQTQQADSGNSPVSNNFRPPFLLSNQEFLYLLSENLEAFLFVITSNEQIVHISDKLKELICIKQTDFQPKYLHDLVDEQSCSSFKHAVSEQMQINGTKSCDEADDSCPEFGLNCAVSNEEILCFVGIGIFSRFPMQTIFRPPAKDKLEFVCKFNMEWKFIYLDQKSTNLTGYNPFELIGLSGYEFYHSDDLDDIVSCHENIIKNGEATSGPYRFRIKADRWIWLKSRYTIVYNKWVAKPECIVGTNQILHGEIPHKTITETVSTTNIESKKLQVKCEPSPGQYCDFKDAQQPDYGRQIFRPQPGVCIEHSPISANNGGSKNHQRKHKPETASAASTNILLDESNAHLVELLLQRENSLKREIMQKERQLQTLQRQCQVRSLTPEATTSVIGNSCASQAQLGAGQNPQSLPMPPMAVSPFLFHQRFDAANHQQQRAATGETLSLASPRSKVWSTPALNLHTNNGGVFNGPRLPY